MSIESKSTRLQVKGMEFKIFVTDNLRGTLSDILFAHEGDGIDYQTKEEYVNNAEKFVMFYDIDVGVHYVVADKDGDPTEMVGDVAATVLVASHNSMQSVSAEEVADLAQALFDEIVKGCLSI